MGVFVPSIICLPRTWTPVKYISANMESSQRARYICRCMPPRHGNIPLHNYCSSLDATYTAQSTLHNPPTTKMSTRPGLESAEHKSQITAAQDAVFSSINELDQLLEKSETVEQAKDICLDVAFEIMKKIEDLKKLLVPKFDDSPLFQALMHAQKGAHESLIYFGRRSDGSLQDIRDKLATFHDAVADFM